MDHTSLTHVLRQSGCVFAEDEAALLLADPRPLAPLVARRVAGHPLQHVLGHVDFCGRRILLDDGVFIPRLRTEHLVHEAEVLLHRGSAVLDLCCGSGAIGAALLRPGVVVQAVDIDPVAVACARRNLPVVYHGDLFAPLPAIRYDVIVANAPYVPSASIDFLPAEARLFEHRVALDGGADGLALHRRLAREAPAWLRPGGHLLVETTEVQAPLTAALFHAAGLRAVITRDEERDATVVRGTVR